MKRGPSDRGPRFLVNQAEGTHAWFNDYSELEPVVETTLAVHQMFLQQSLRIAREHLRVVW